MTEFTLAGGNVFVASWALRSKRIVAALHHDPDSGGWILKGDTFGGYRNVQTHDRAAAIAWADEQVRLGYPNAIRTEGALLS